MNPGTIRVLPFLVSAVWTALVWTTRIRNIWTDDELGTAGRIGRSVPVVLFTVAAAVLATVAVRLRPDPATRQPAWIEPAVGVVAVWTVGFWVVRAVQIAAADHSGVFVAVHVVLAAVSVGLAVWALLRARVGGRTDHSRRMPAAGSGPRE